LFAATSRAAKGQQPGRIYRIGLLTFDARTSPTWDAFVQRMHEHGWAEGKNFVVDRRSVEGRSETVATLAKELVTQDVDVIIAGGTEATLAAREATGTIPIVGIALGDPLGAGLVASLARPGGNVTGSSFQGTELTGKQLELIKEAFPGISRVAVLVNLTNASHAPRVKEAAIAAHKLKLQLDVVEAGQVSQLDAAFAGIVSNRDEAVLVLTDPLFDREADRIAYLAGAKRVPAIYGRRERVLNGGLMSYGASFSDLFRETADYVDKILRGAKPADLPIKQPTHFELIVNMKTAKALGLTIPQSLLLRADEVIQ